MLRTVSPLSQFEVDARRFRPSIDTHFQIALIVEVFDRARPFTLVATALQEFGANELTEHELLLADRVQDELRNGSRSVAVNGYPHGGVN